jgi:hypothetical protein
MAECNQWDKASQQHMARRQQEALIAVQALEHQRLHQHQVGEQLQSQNQQPEKPQNLPIQIQTLCLTEGN